MARRWPAAAVSLVLAVGCTSTSGPNDGDDPSAGAAATSAPDRAGGGYRPSTLLGQITDPAITESSGLAASRRNPGLLWTHNDSDDGAFVYCVDLQGRSCGTWQVTGAEAFDWEDMAVGPGPLPAQPYLYLGDIGDNIDQRSEIVVYRVAEPAAGAGGRVPAKTAPAATAPAEALLLRYPDGPHNAEALLVHPATGDVYVVSKEEGAARVYKASAPLDASTVETMTQVGDIRLGNGGRGLGPVTGGDISPDGRRVALCTYAQGYEMDLAEDAAFDSVWAEPPVPVDLGPRLQGEAIAYRLDGRALLTTSEIVPSPLQQVERR